MVAEKLRPWKIAAHRDGTYTFHIQKIEINHEHAARSWLEGREK